MSTVCCVEVLSKSVTFLDFRLSQGNVQQHIAGAWGGNLCIFYEWPTWWKNFENRSKFAEKKHVISKCTVFIGPPCIIANKEICDARHSRQTRPGNLRMLVFTQSKSDHFHTNQSDFYRCQQWNTVASFLGPAYILFRSPKRYTLSVYKSKLEFGKIPFTDPLELTEFIANGITASVVHCEFIISIICCQFGKLHIRIRLITSFRIYNQLYLQIWTIKITGCAVAPVLC